MRLRYYRKEDDASGDRRGSGFDHHSGGAGWSAENRCVARKGNSWNAVEQVIHRVNSRTDCKVCMYELKDEVQMRKSIDESAILINASSVGMSPHEEGCLVPDVSYFHPELIVSDVIYQPRKTRLLQMAESVGCPTFNGSICCSIREPMRLNCGPVNRCR